MSNFIALIQMVDDAARSSQEKEPWLAVNLSSLWPGLGQIYAGDKRRGWVLGLIQFGLSLISIWCLISDKLPFASIFILLVGMMLGYIYSLVDAYNSIRQRNSPAFTELRTSQKDPWLAVLLNRFFIVPIGHLYLGKPLKGLLLLIALICLVLLAGIVSLTFKKLGLNSLPISIAINLIWGIFVIERTYRDAHQHRSDRGLKRLLVAFGVTLLINLLFATLLRTIVFEARYIPSGAMLPTIQINDRLIIDKLTYRFNQPEHGDIIVFDPPATLMKEGFKDAFIKRIIGIPGDTVKVQAGKVYVNDRVLVEPYLDEAPQYNWNSAELTPSGIIPDRHYLVLGDNRNNSYDSHYWGFVPRENIIGRVTKRFWPFSRAGNL